MIGIFLIGVASLGFAEESQPNFISGGDFESTGYKGGSSLQPGWHIVPWQDPNGYQIAGIGESYQGKHALHVRYTGKPNAPTGWKLLLVVPFASVPKDEFEFSMAARGRGVISATIYKYSVEITDGKEKEIYRGILGGLDKTEVSGDWKIYNAKCSQPEDKDKIDRVKGVIEFYPGDNEAVDIFIDDVKALPMKP